ncbi:MAG: hypothetical protein PHC43_00270 [Candidatus Marinimicrobia bacterium]|jgi:hypothetical protein|nr:hypothetical protein [Candidatus Neomarinimicrobiota bacterium]
MDSGTKTALGVATGILVGKWGGNLAWWALGGVLTFAILKQPQTRAYIVRTSKTAFSSLKREPKEPEWAGRKIRLK